MSGSFDAARSGVHLGAQKNGKALRSKRCTSASIAALARGELCSAGCMARLMFSFSVMCAGRKGDRWLRAQGDMESSCCSAVGQDSCSSHLGSWNKMSASK